MTIGRKDYVSEVIPVRSMYRADQVMRHDRYNDTIAGGGLDDVFEYAVPAGYLFQPVSFWLTSNLPAIHKCMFVPIDGVDFYWYFNTSLFVHFPSGSEFTVSPGFTSLLRVWNLDTVDGTFTCVFNGFRYPNVY